jgi:Holliday junction resolvase RusA-like endonuclease
MNVITIGLPTPPAILNPNKTIGSRGGRMAKARAIKIARKHAADWARISMLERQIAPPPRWSNVSVRCLFFYPTRRRRDKDNALASMKAYFDGIADSGLVANDSAMTFEPVELLVDKMLPRVEVVITNLEVSSEVPQEAGGG